MTEHVTGAGLPPVYVINLRWARHRRNRISKNLRSLGVAFERIDAVDGALLTEEAVNERCVRDEFFRDPHARIGALGCSLSHIEAYKRIVASGAKVGVILEDDCIVTSDFPYVVPTIADHLAGQQAAALLYCESMQGVLLRRQPAHKATGTHSLYRPADPRAICSTLAYVITREAAELMASRLLPVRYVADRWATFLEIGLLDDVFIAHPFVVENALLSGTIDYTKGRFPRPLRNFVDRVPLLRGRLRDRRAAYIDRVTVVSFSDIQ